MLRSFSKRRGAASGVAVGFLISFGIAAAAYFLCAFVAALIADSTDDPTGYVGTAALCSLVLSGFIGGAVNSRLRGASGFGVAMLAALSVALVTIAVALVSCGGVSPSGLMNAVSYMGGGVVGAFLGKPRERRRRRRR